MRLLQGGSWREGVSHPGRASGKSPTATRILRVIVSESDAGSEPSQMKWWDHGPQWSGVVGTRIVDAVKTRSSNPGGRRKAYS